MALPSRSREIDMSVISFATPKGGAGKTTSALLLATELATLAEKVAIIDGDPEKWITEWSILPGKPENIDVFSEATEDNIVELIDDCASKYPFVIVDLEGTANLMIAYAIGLSDLVVIPVQGSKMDAKGAIKTVRLIRQQEKVSRRKIAHQVLYTRTSAAVPTRALKNVMSQIEELNVSAFDTQIVQRAAYGDLTDYGGTLRDLDPDQVSNLDKAIENATAYMKEVIGCLKAAEIEGVAA